MSMTIAGLSALAAAELARHAPEIQRAAVDFIRENKHVIVHGTKTMVKCTDWKKVEDDVKDTAKAASDYVNHKGWDKK